MRLVDFLDKGASLGPDAPCLRLGADVRSYRDVQRLSVAVGRALQRDGIVPGDKVAILSANDSVAFSCVFGISRAGAVWCPINPRNAATENAQLLDLFDCRALIFQHAFLPMIAEIADQLPQMSVLVCLDGPTELGPRFDDWIAHLLPAGDDLTVADPVDDVAMIAGTGGTTGKPKGVQLTGSNLETMTAITLIGYPFRGRPVYLALAPLTHAAGVLCFPIMTLGGEVVIMNQVDLGEFWRLIEQRRVTHAMLTPTLLYMALAHDQLPRTDLSSLQCFWYGAAPMSAHRLAEALDRIGPVLAQYFGQTEAPMVATTMAPEDHFRPDGSIFTERLSAAGRAAPLVRLAIMDPDGALLATGQRGEIVLRSSLVSPGYYKDPEATAAVSAYGWHHTGDIGYLDDDGFLFIVDRAKDMIISGGFNVYSAEVEQVVMEFPQVQDCGVIGLPDEKWGERVIAVVQPRAGQTIDLDELRSFVRARLGGVKTPKQFEVWPDLPRSRVGKVLKREIREHLLAEPTD
jgi:fatty-acyl-CoA synthase